MLFDRSVVEPAQRLALTVSLFGTILLWILMFIGGSIIASIKKEPEYHTINIILEQPKPVPAENKPVEKEAPAQAQTAPEVQQTKIDQQQVAPVQTPVPPVKKVEQSKVAPDATKPAVKETPKPVPSPADKESPSVQKPAAPTQKDVIQPKPEVSAPKKENIVYKKSVEELIAEQQQGNTAKKAVDWDAMFGDDNDAESNDSVSPVNNSVQTGISGAAALSGTSAVSSGGAEKAVAKTDTQNVSQTTSTSTKSSLSKIASTTFVKNQTLDNGFVATTSTTTQTSTDGKSSLVLSDGTSRVLLDPSKPVIMISPENGSLIDSPRTVVINFKVLAGGNVPLSGITFTPSALLPPQIQSEIREQISTWRFMPGPTDGQAKFELEIKKR